jgi:hypothetical protein
MPDVGPAFFSFASFNNASLTTTAQHKLLE